MVDRDAIFGMVGTASIFSGSLHEYIGVIAGSLTIIFMSFKIWGEIKARKK
jgi:hypothetical protein